jgi:hypothetical protein
VSGIVDCLVETIPRPKTCLAEPIPGPEISYEVTSIVGPKKGRAEATEMVCVDLCFCHQYRDECISENRLQFAICISSGNWFIIFWSKCIEVFIQRLF